MFGSEENESREFYVVVNHEEQYSIWPKDRAIPAGWREAGKSGRRQECLSHIQEVWTDMRPLSLRKQMAAEAAAQGAKRSQPTHSAQS